MYVKSSLSTESYCTCTILLRVTLFLFCFSAVSRGFVYSLCAVCIQFVCSLYTVCVQFVYSLCAVCIQFVCSLYTVCVQFVYSFLFCCIVVQSHNMNKITRFEFTIFTQFLFSFVKQYTYHTRNKPRLFKSSPRMVYVFHTFLSYKQYVGNSIH